MSVIGTPSLPSNPVAGPDASGTWARVRSGVAPAPHRRQRLATALARVRQAPLADTLFGAALLLCALSLFALLALILVALVHGSWASLATFGWSFLTGRTWNPVVEQFGVIPFVWGTLISSAVALLIAAPGALAVAIFALEICPRPLRAALGFLTELLATIPSVVYGLWALIVLVPLMRERIGPALQHTLGWTGLFAAPNYGVGVLTASIVLAIMIFPVITAVSRDIMAAVPRDQTEALLALGATRWEAVRTGILRNARLGIAGSLILGLGRALGETMATALVIGNHPALFHSLLAPGYTMASVLANEFAEASGDLHLSALTEVGLVLLLVTALVNAVARVLVWLVLRAQRSPREAQP